MAKVCVETNLGDRLGTEFAFFLRSLLSHCNNLFQIMLGSFLLHQMSLDMDLDFFVMFSSMASIVGNMGQSSYSACNAFQDSLAQYRRHLLGLPGLAINWGPISGAGVMDRETGIAKLMNKVGLGFIHAKEGKMYSMKYTYRKFLYTDNCSRCQLSCRL